MLERHLAAPLRAQELPTNRPYVLQPDEPIGRCSGPHIAPRGDFYLLVSGEVTYRSWERPVFREDGE